VIAASLRLRPDPAGQRDGPVIMGGRYRGRVPRYDFRCRECAATFEVTRPMSASGEPAACPAGHVDTVKLLPTVAVGGRSGSPMPAGRGGGCCGGGCGCG
jgi:putative FmdB family regulatory protein